MTFLLDCLLRYFLADCCRDDSKRKARGHVTSSTAAARGARLEGTQSFAGPGSMAAGFLSSGLSSNNNMLLSCLNTSLQALGNVLPQSLRLRMSRDCAAGLAHLHSKNFMHCDIKSLNFLGT